MSSDRAPGTPAQPARALVAALRRMLRPLVALLIRQQVHYPFLVDLLKALYVDVASSQFQLEGRPVTLSRLSLLTGIHRREAKRVRDAAGADAETPSAITLGAQVIARWTGERRWMDERGRPRALPRAAPAGENAEEDRSFGALVASVSVDIHPRSLLDEWLRLGVVELDEQSCVALRSAAFVPARGYDEKAHFIGRNLGDHMSAAFDNLGSDDPRFLERAVYYGALPAADVREIEAQARKLGEDALLRVNASALAAKQANETNKANEANEAAESGKSSGDRRRLTFGVYFYQAPADPAADETNHD